MPIDLRQQSRKLYGNKYPKLNAAAEGAGFPAGYADRNPYSTAAILDANPGYQAPARSPEPGAAYRNTMRQNGLMNDAQAASHYAASGYMPRTTVGGAYGQRASNLGQRQQAGAAPGEYISPRISQQDIMRGTDPTRDALVGQATTAKLLENPNGRWFQGAQVNPRANSGPGISTFVTPGYSADQLAQAEGRWELAARRADERSKTLSRSSTGAIVGSLNPDFAPPTAEQLAQNKREYDARRSRVQLDRQNAVVANAQQRAAERRDRMNGPSQEEILTARNPAYGIAMANLRAQQGNAQAGRENDLALQQERNKGALGVAQAEADARRNEQSLAYRAQRLAAGASPEEVDRELAAYGGQQGTDLTQPASVAKRVNNFTDLTPQQQREYYAMPAEQRGDYFRSIGIQHEGLIGRLEEQAAGGDPDQPGILESPAGKFASSVAESVAAPFYGAFGTPEQPVVEAVGGLYGSPDLDLSPSPNDTPAQKNAKAKFIENRRKRKELVDRFTKAGWGRKSAEETADRVIANSP